MRRTIWSLLCVLGIFVVVGFARADEEAKKSDAVPAKAENKAEEQKKEETKKEDAKSDETQKDETKQDDAKKEEEAKKKENNAKKEEEAKKKAEEVAKKTLEKKLKTAKRLDELKKTVQDAIDDEEWDKALATYDKIIDDKDFSRQIRVAALGDKFTILVEEMHDGKKASQVAKKICEFQRNDSQILNDLAWMMLDTEGLENRDLDLALEFAEKANVLTQGKSGAILDTLARAHYEKGNLEKAVEFQTKAVAQLDKESSYLDDDDKEDVKAMLEQYQDELAEKKKNKSVEKKEEKKADKEEKKNEEQKSEKEEKKGL